ALTYQPNHFFADPNDNTVGAFGTKQIGNTARLASYAGMGVEMECDDGLMSSVDKYNQGLDYLNGAVEFKFDGPDYYRNWYNGLCCLYNASISHNTTIREFYDNVYQVMKGTYKIRPYISSLAGITDPNNLLGNVKYKTSLSVGDPNADGGPQGNYIGDNSGSKLTDNLWSSNCGDGATSLYHGGFGSLKTADFMFDLGSSKAFSQVNVSTQSGANGIGTPGKIQIQVSNDVGDNKTWQTVYAGVSITKLDHAKNFIYKTPQNEKIVARFIKFNIDFGSDPWIGIDEIELLGDRDGRVADDSLTVPSTQPDAAQTPTFSVNLPTEKSISIGESASLTVTAATADGGALSYQWYKDGTAIGTDSNTFTIANASEADNGNYSVAVTNTKGTTTAAATSVICAVPVLNDNNL
ncbi:MAG: DUF4855 domain-containing protein, partial [Acinetobacter sp.]